MEQHLSFNNNFLEVTKTVETQSPQNHCDFN